jgi:hypothetical protein
MVTSTTVGAVVLCCAAMPLAGQLTATVVPTTAPLGCSVAITISNDTNTLVNLPTVCPSSYCSPVEIFNGSGQMVSALGAGCCQIGGALPFPPGQSITWWWNQQGLVGTGWGQVPAGNYLVDVGPVSPTAPITNLPIPFTIGGTNAGIGMLGTPKTGTIRNLLLCAPGDGGFPFVLAASTRTGPGIASCNGTIPLFPDALFSFSLTPGNGIFDNFTGILDAQGESTTPSITVPNDPGLIGFSIVVDFVAADPSALCPIRTIGAPAILTVQ